MVDKIYRRNFKITLVGGAYGKSCLIQRKKGFNPFDYHYYPWDESDFIETVKINNKLVKFTMLDTSGQKRYRSLTLSSIKNSAGILIICDVTNLESFKDIDYWIDGIKEKCNLNSIIIYIVGNKIDEINRRCVTFEDAKNLAAKNNLKYFEISVKTGEGIEELFKEMYIDIYKKWYNIDEKIESKVLNDFNKLNILNKYISY